MQNKEIRRINLRALIEEAGGVPQLAAKACVSDKYLRQILTGFMGPKDRNPRQVGDALARKIERGCGKPLGWMDAVHGVHAISDVGDTEDLAADFMSLPDSEQEEIRLYVKTRAAIAKMTKK